MADTELQESLTLPSTIDSVDIVEAKVEEIATRAGFDEDSVGQIAMISREAAANAVLHGNRSDATKKIVARFALTDEALSIQVADEGAGFDPEKVANPLSPEGLMRASGRGIFLMRDIMDDVHFRQLTPGTEITLVKRRKQV